jgi:hypothetical protein
MLNICSKNHLSTTATFFKSTCSSWEKVYCQRLREENDTKWKFYQTILTLSFLFKKNLGKNYISNFGRNLFATLQVIVYFCTFVAPKKAFKSLPWASADFLPREGKNFPGNDYFWPARGLGGAREPFTPHRTPMIAPQKLV